MRSQKLHHIGGGAYQVWGVPRKVEITGVGPKTEALLIDCHQTTSAINNRSTLPQGTGALGLKLACLLFQGRSLHQLEPSHPADEAQQARAKDQKNNPQAVRWNWRQRNNP